MATARMRARPWSTAPFFAVASALVLACGARTPISTGIPEDASVPLDAAIEAAADAPPDVIAVCNNQRRACLTTAELIELWNHPPEGAPKDAGPPPLDPDGCLPANVVRDDCCQAAITGPEVEAGTCCYRFCVGACCDGTR